uniref:Small G protein signalling modulator 1/2 Rab-binding domain-containing protein n=1 Tax=Callorhinchus milii TaxID=7868 RepID=A0A4W3GP20_CALMI
SPSCQGSDTVLDWMPDSERGQSSEFAYTKRVSVGASGHTEPEEDMFDPGYEPDWAVISTVRPRAPVAPSPGAHSKWAFSLSLTDLKSIRKNKPGLGWSYLIFITRDGISFPALHFHAGGSWALLKLSQAWLMAPTPLPQALALITQVHRPVSLTLY